MYVFVIKYTSVKGNAKYCNIFLTIFKTFKNIYKKSSQDNIISDYFQSRFKEKSCTGFLRYESHSKEESIAN